MGRERGDCKLSELEADSKELGYRTIQLAFSVQSYSDQNALDIGHSLLQHMKDEEIIGPSDGNVILGP